MKGRRSYEMYRICSADRSRIDSRAVVNFTYSRNSKSGGIVRDHSVWLFGGAVQQLQRVAHLRGERDSPVRQRIYLYRQLQRTYPL